MAALSITVDAVEIEELADQIVQLDARKLGGAAQRAVNTVAIATHQKIVSRITTGINLSDAYVRDRVYVEPARSAASAVVRAEIIAPGPRSAKAKNRKTAGGPITSLRNYAPVQLTQPVKYSNDRIATKLGQWGTNPRKAGGFLRWKARVGDQMRGIPVGQKQAGVSVEVTRGQRKKIGLRNVFLMPLKRGKSLDMSRLGVFSRDPGDSKKAIQLRLGPSVYQLLNRTAPELIDDVQRDLRTALVGEVRKVVDEVLS